MLDSAIECVAAALRDFPLHITTSVMTPTSGRIYGVTTARGKHSGLYLPNLKTEGQG